MLRRLLTLIFVLFTGILTGCGPTEAEPALRPLTFMAGFKPQANLPFVGVYVAQEKGFFAEEGLDVTIQHSAGGGEHLQLLAAGEVQVTTQDAAVLLQRRADPGLPLVSLGLVGQRGQQAFVALAESGLQTPADWVGHTIGYKGTPPPDLFAILAANDVDPAQVELVNVGFDPRVLTEGLVDVYPVFKSNEPNLIRGWGYDLVQWEAADYDVPTLGLTYVATEEMVTQEPALLRSFMAAVMRGIDYAKEHPEEAVTFVMQYAGEEADPDHMRFMLDTELADYESEVTGEYGPGWQTTEQWQALADMLRTYEALSEPVDVERAFTNAFLPQVESDQ